ncbi:unnamed protein product [Chrysoparadoxa australica]
MKLRCMVVLWKQGGSRSSKMPHQHPKLSTNPQLQVWLEQHLMGTGRVRMEGLFTFKLVTCHLLPTPSRVTMLDQLTTEEL